MNSKKINDIKSLMSLNNDLYKEIDLEIDNEIEHYK